MDIAGAGSLPFPAIHSTLFQFHILVAAGTTDSVRHDITSIALNLPPAAEYADVIGLFIFRIFGGHATSPLKCLLYGKTHRVITVSIIIPKNMEDFKDLQIHAMPFNFPCYCHFML